MRVKKILHVLAISGTLIRNHLIYFRKIQFPVLEKSHSDSAIILHDRILKCDLPTMRFGTNVIGLHIVLDKIKGIVPSNRATCGYPENISVRQCVMIAPESTPVVALFGLSWFKMYHCPSWYVVQVPEPALGQYHQKLHRISPRNVRHKLRSNATWRPASVAKR